jgi:hypothetical protein
MRQRILPLTAVAALALVPALAHAQTAPVTKLERPTQVRELGGTVVYSAFDPAVGAYRLMVRDAQGGRALPVPAAREPFEADIGTNTKGTPQVIFSFDVGPQAGGQAGGRDLFVITLGSGEVRPVRNANTSLPERTPTIDEGRIAFSRTYGPGADFPEPVVYTKRLVAPRKRPSTRLPGVPHRLRTTYRSVSELELGGGLLGQVVTFTIPEDMGDGAPFATDQVRQVQLDDRSSRLVASTTSGQNDAFYVGLSFAEDYLAWYQASQQGNPAAGAYRYQRGRAYRYAKGPRYLSGFAWTGDGTWQVRSGPDGRCPKGADCRLVRTDDLDWEIIDRGHVR